MAIYKREYKKGGYVGYGSTSRATKESGGIDYSAAVPLRPPKPSLYKKGGMAGLTPKEKLAKIKAMRKSGELKRRKRTRKKRILAKKSRSSLSVKRTAKQPDYRREHAAGTPAAQRNIERKQIKATMTDPAASTKQRKTVRKAGQEAGHIRVATTKTKGGNYPTYRKDTYRAKDFGKTFAAARKAGKKTFMWKAEGTKTARKYTTELAK